MVAPYEVIAIRYAHLERDARHNFLGGDEHDDGPMPLDYYVWAIVNAERTILVDTGFDHDTARRRGRQIVRPVAEGLQAVGISPDRIEDIVISHMDYDHAGNHDLFPRARYHLQDSEMAYATGRFMCHAAPRLPFEVDDVTAMVRKVFAGRVQFHDGAGEIVPGVSVHHIGGHSKGLQCVRVRTRRGEVVLAADAAHLYAHLDTGRIFPTTYSVAEAAEGYARLRRLASSSQHVVPGHDPLVLARYPPAKPALEGWVVRLDMVPKG